MTDSDRHERLVLEGPLVLSEATAIKDKILMALAGSSSISIDVSAASEIDISFLQILVAARKTAELEDKSIEIMSSGSERLADQIARCGLPTMTETGSFRYSADQ